MANFFLYILKKSTLPTGLIRIDHKLPRQGRSPIAIQRAPHCDPTPVRHTTRQIASDPAFRSGGLCCSFVPAARTESDLTLLSRPIDLAATHPISHSRTDVSADATQLMLDRKQEQT